MTKRHSWSAMMLIGSTFAGLFLTVDALADDAAQADDTRGTSSVRLEEVIVTAQKRQERLQDVPVSVTALNTDTLADTNLSRLQDYFNTVPGLSFTTAGSGQVEPTIRGLNSSGGNPTVAATLDDVPMGTSSALTGNQGFTPDIDPSSLSQIEVLRGPQGTLYGANSLGGLIKYVTADPSTQGISGRLQVDGDGVRNGDGLGYAVRGGVNLPATDSLAFRVSAFNRLDPGYIDNPTLGLKGVNRSESSGGLASALWRPSDSFSIKLTALIQDMNIDGSSTTLSNLGDLQQNFLLGTGNNDIRMHLYAATVHARLGAVDFTSVSGYSIQEAIGNTDFSNYIPGSAYYSSTRTNRFTQEFRFSSSIGHAVDWLVGGFYSHESSPADQSIYFWNATTGMRDPSQGVPGAGGLLVDSNFPSTFEQYAGFADVTAHFTEHFDLQLGARQSHDQQVYTETDTGPFVPDFFGVPTPLYLAPERSSENSFTYLVTPQWKVSQNLMVYGRVASGFRPGGPNIEAELYHTPETYAPDKTTNYELGVKGNSPNHLFSFDSAVYYIDWKDIQLNVYSEAGALYFANGSHAKSEGVEFSGQVQPIEGLTFSGWAAWNEAVLTEDLPPSTLAIGQAGDRLPNSSRWSGNLVINEEFPVAAAVTGHIRGTVVYMSDQLSVFSSASANPQPRYVLPSYTAVNLLAGVNYRTWAVNVFANNITDRRAVLNIRPWTESVLRYDYIQPRTIGLSVQKTF